MADEIIWLALLLSLAASGIAARDLEHNQELLVSVFHEDHIGDVGAPDAASIEWAHTAQDLEQGPTLTMRLMHRDSPHSPLRIPNASLHETLTERLRRDAARASALSRRAAAVATPSTSKLDARGLEGAGFTGPIVSGLKQGSGEYFTRLGVGTPARQTYMVIDTGSDVMWLQCAPCVDCYPQTDPVFNPRSSSSFRRLPCTSRMCGMLELHGCEARSNLCMYQVAYGDGSFTTGEFSVETLSFKGTTVRGVGFGCGHDNEGLFAGASGLFGLGGGTLSFPSQAGGQFSKVFSYCLVGRSSKQGAASTLVFGKGGVPKATMFTPLLKNPSLETFYYVAMTGISVGGALVTIPSSAFRLDAAGDGGVIIDSGTSVSRLVETAYGPLRSAFRAATRGLLPFSGGVSLFDTCYDLSGRARVKVPSLALHFQGGATMALPASNYLVPVDSSGTHCLAFASTPGALSIIGNIQQQGFRVVFDGVASRLGFAADQC